MEQNHSDIGLSICDIIREISKSKKHVDKPLFAEEPVESLAGHNGCSSDRDLYNQVDHQNLQPCGVAKNCRLR